MFSRWVVLSCLFVVAVSSVSRADEVRLELETRVANGIAEAQASGDRLRREIEESRLRDPQLTVDLVSIETPAPAGNADTERSQRLFMTVARGFVSGGAATISLVLQGSPSLLAAVATALPLAIFSGAVQLNLDRFNRWITRNGQASRVESLVRWGSAEIFFTSLASAMTHATGISHDPILTSAGSVLLSALLGTFTQGPWDTALAELHHHELRTRVAAIDRLRLLNGLRSLGVSLASVALNLAVLSRSPVAFGGLAALGATGFGALYWVKLKRARCEAILSSPR